MQQVSQTHLASWQRKACNNNNISAASTGGMSQTSTIVAAASDGEMACRADEVRVTGEDREPLGIMSLMEALDMADESGVDVVLITPDADPPVVRLIEYSKYKFEQAKASKEASKKQREAR